MKKEPIAHTIDFAAWRQLVKTLPDDDLRRFDLEQALNQLEKGLKHAQQVEVYSAIRQLDEVKESLAVGSPLRVIIDKNTAMANELLSTELTKGYLRR